MYMKAPMVPQNSTEKKELRPKNKKKKKKRIGRPHSSGDFLKELKSADIRMD